MRVYSEAEIAQILRRAADRQAQQARAAPERGLTLTELEALAAESGLDVAHVRAAAAEVAPVARAERSRSATHVFVERTVEAPLTDGGWDEAVVTLQNRFGKDGLAAFGPGAAPSGTAMAVGRSREWSHTDGLGVETRVMATDRGGTTRLRLSQRVGLMGERGESLLYGLLLGLPVAFALARALPGAALFLWLLVPVLAVASVYALDARWRRSKQDALEEMSDTLAEVVAAHGAAAAVRAPATPEAPETARASAPVPPLSLDALGEAPGRETGTAEGRRAERA